jgi:ATP-dependent DNA helicase RecG
MTNTTVRERFGIEQKNMVIASRIIKEALETGLICVYGETTSKKHKCYVPFWASGIIKNVI